MPMTWRMPCRDDAKPEPFQAGKPTRDDILVVIGLAQARSREPFGCEECQCCSVGGCDYYGECDSSECTARPFMANLRTFPFKRVPAKCHEQGHFCLSFWVSEFMHLYWMDGPDDMDEKLSLRVWRMSGPTGDVKLNERNQRRVDEALARFMAMKPMEGM